MKLILLLTASVLALAGCSSSGPQNRASGGGSLPDGTVVIDVRTPEEYAAGHVTGSTNVPVGELAQRINQVVPSTKTPVAVHCRSGGRARTATELLTAKGYKVKNLGSLENARATVEGK